MNYFCKTIIVIVVLILTISSNAQDFKNLSFNGITDGKLDHWVLEGDGDYVIINQDVVRDTVLLYNDGNSFVKFIHMTPLCFKKQD